MQTYLEQHKERFLNELLNLLRIPSVSADSKYSSAVNEMAKAVAENLKAIGADNVQLLPTQGYPVVYADKIINPNLPTVLVYGHYDVQPPDPLALWHSPPFEPVVKEGNICARGACDDKGQFFMHLKAFEMMMQTTGLPCNVKFLIEGEEEVGSANLPDFLRENAQRYACDVVLISDTGMIANDIPSIDVGLRGLSYVEVEITGPSHDLHSGTYGGAVANPINVLCTMIASMHDENRHITIPGFYDDVIELTANERNALNSQPFDLNKYKEHLKVADVMGEKGYTTIERTGIRPTLELNGIWGGYIGEGATTVLPSNAYAKISMRLVAIMT